MSETVLLTGANGFLGFHILLATLRRTQFNVRAVLRSQEKVDAILAHPTIKRIAAGPRLSFTIIDDITRQGACREALRGISFVLHVASPQAKAATSDYKASLLEPTLKGTVEILTSAAKTRSVKRVILTSCLVANRYLDTPLNKTTTAETRVPIPQGPFDAPFAAYAAAQTTALKATDMFFDELKPRFDIFTIMPGLIIGRNELAATELEILDGGNQIAMSHIVGHPPNGCSIPLRATAHLEDVVKVHVESLQLNASGRRVFGVTSPMDWKDSFSIVQKHFPEAVESGIFRDAALVGLEFPWDASETERVFNMRFKAYEEQVTSIATQYLELVRR